MAYQRGEQHWMHRHPEMVPKGDDHYKVREKSAEERFWAKVEKGDDCWEWQGFIVPEGYGRFYVRQDGKSWMRAVRAHRFAWEAQNGPLESGECVLHRCDNPRCVNPGHLFLGTPGDNSADMVRKGRQAMGERNPKAVLTESDVVAIRAANGDGISTVKLSRMYGVHQATVWKIVRRKTWKHVL